MEWFFEDISGRFFYAKTQLRFFIGMSFALISLSLSKVAIVRLWNSNLIEFDMNLIENLFLSVRVELFDRDIFLITLDTW